MKIFLHKKFVKSYKKLRRGEQLKFKAKRDLFLRDPFHSILNNHALHGKYHNYRSISITGDLRVLFKHIDEKSVLFYTIDTHSNLYE